VQNAGNYPIPLMLSKNGVVSTISTDLLSHEAIGFPLVSLISARYKTLEIILFS